MHRPRRQHFARIPAITVALTALFGGACLSPSKDPVFEEDGVEIFLRSDKRLFATVEKGFGHPVRIAPVRVAHILSRLDLRPPQGLFSDEKDAKRVGAIRTEVLYTIGEGVSKALAEAGPDQEVVVMAIEKTERWGIFDHDYLTSFVAYVRDERLYLHFARFHWEIPERREDRIPEPRVGDHPQRFRLYAGTAMALVNDQAVAIDWRDPIFARPTRTRILPGGGVVRREILLESPPEVDEIDDPVRRMPDDLSPGQLRELADVEEARREGRITETEYRIRRRKILDPGG